MSNSALFNKCVFEDVYEDENGWITFNAYQYFVSPYSSLEDSWDDAQATCVSLRASSNLVQIDDVVENTFILSLLFQLKANDLLQNSAVWFGNALSTHIFCANDNN